MAADRRTAPTLILCALLLAAAGCSEGDVLAPAATADAVDTAPPAPPAGLVATDADGLAKLRWEANTTDADLVGYRVYELAFGGAHCLVEEPLQRTWWADPTPPSHVCQYAVTAVDAAGNESAWCTVTWAGAPGLPDREAGR